MKKVLVTGGNGQLAQCLKEVVPQSAGWTFASSDELDITVKASIDEWLAKGYDYVVNCAAYTDVDRAEGETDRCTAINAVAPGILAECCRLHGCWLIHISTDYVFGGSASVPAGGFRELAGTEPISHYGKTKAEGEDLIRASGCNYYIIRTAWLYSSIETGSNFMKTMYRRILLQVDSHVVDDQIGSPTSARSLSTFISYLISEASPMDRSAIYHFTDDGVASWYDFAKEIEMWMRRASLVKRADPYIIPCSTEDYHTTAKRPSFSILNKTFTKNDNESFEFRDWRDALHEELGRYTLNHLSKHK